MSLKHKGYVGSLEYSPEDSVLHGRILGISGLITYEGESVKEIETAFREAVDDYLEWCKERGKEPEKPFSGKLNLRMGRTRHQKVAELANKRNISINEIILNAIDKVLPG